MPASSEWNVRERHTSTACMPEVRERSAFDPPASFWRSSWLALGLTKLVTALREFGPAAFDVAARTVPFDSPEKSIRKLERSSRVLSLTRLARNAESAEEWIRGATEPDLLRVVDAR